MSQKNAADPAEQLMSYALRSGVIEFTPEGRALKSGRISPYFFNSERLSAGGPLGHLANSFVAAIEKERKFRPRIIFGHSHKGIPLAVAIALKFGGNTGYAFNCGEGGNATTGMPLEGQNVLIVDDVITTGASSKRAIEIIKSHGGIPIGCVIAFDRQERGNESSMSAVQEFEQRYGIPVRAAATLTDLISYLQKVSDSNAEQYRIMVEKILEYQKKYGVTE